MHIVAGQAAVAGTVSLGDWRVLPSADCILAEYLDACPDAFLGFRRPSDSPLPFDCSNLVPRLLASVPLQDFTALRLVVSGSDFDAVAAVTLAIVTAMPIRFKSLAF